MAALLMSINGGTILLLSINYRHTANATENVIMDDHVLQPMILESNYISTLITCERSHFNRVCIVVASIPCPKVTSSDTEHGVKTG